MLPTATTTVSSGNNASGILDVGWGSGGVVDGFDAPFGVAVDGSGNLYVADSGK